MSNDLYPLSWVYTGGSPPAANEITCLHTCTEVAARWHLAGVTGARVLKWSEGYRDTVAWQALARRSFVAARIAHHQTLATQEMAREFAKTGFPHVFLKAAALRAIEPSRLGDRCGWDIDLGVQRSNLVKAYDALCRLGYQSHTEPSIGPLRYARHFEAISFSKAIELRTASSDEVELFQAEAELNDLPLTGRPGSAFNVDVSVDIQSELGYDLSLDPLINSRRVGSGNIYVPAKEYLLFLLIRKMYIESHMEYRSNMHMYFDIINILPSMSDLEIEGTTKLLSTNNTAIPALYVLRRLPVSFGIDLPEMLDSFIQKFNRVCEEGTPTSLNDFGDMWPKMIGVR